MIKEYLKRFFICALGLACFAIGNVFGIHAGSAGTNAWNTLALGISGQTSLSFGTVTLLISGLVVLIDIMALYIIIVGTVAVIAVVLMKRILTGDKGDHRSHGNHHQYHNADQETL